MIRDSLGGRVAEGEQVTGEVHDSLIRAGAIRPGIEAIALRHHAAVVFAQVKHGCAIGIVCHQRAEVRRLRRDQECRRYLGEGIPLRLPGDKTHGHQGIQHDAQRCGRRAKRLTQGGDILCAWGQRIEELKLDAAFQHPGGPQTSSNVQNGFW
jgi:hypothetical protein